MIESLLRFDRVTGVTEECVLDGAVSFDLARGQVGILRGGAEASAFLRMACLRGIVTDGTMTILGQALSAADRPSRYLAHRFRAGLKTAIGFCHQRGGLLSNMTLVENVALPAHYHSDISAMEPFLGIARQRMTDIGVPPAFWNLRPSDATREMQKRTLLARAVVNEPVVLLLDEPTDDIPWARVPGIAAWILEQKNAGRGVLIATSNDPLAGAVGDWVLDVERNSYHGDRTAIETALGEAAWGGVALLKKSMGGSEDAV